MPLPSRSPRKESGTSAHPSPRKSADTSRTARQEQSASNVRSSYQGEPDTGSSSGDRIPRNGILSSDSRVEQVRRRTGVGYVGLNVSAEDLERADADDSRAIVWFDIDNTLYHKSTRIAQLMGQRIHAYFLGLGLPEAEAKALHTRYYKEHGLAIRGLLKHHSDIDPLDYDRRVDGSLPLDDLLKPEAELTALLRDLDRTKCRVFALTNAYKSHALRCIRLLGLEDFFDGALYCDYAAGPLFCCKPDLGYYHAAAEIVGTKDTTKFYFVDDSEKNIRAAKELGWQSAVFYNEPEPEDEAPQRSHGARETQEEREAVDALNCGGLTMNGSAQHLDEKAIGQQVQSLSVSQRLKLFDIILRSALPSEIPSMQKAWKRYMSSTKDVVSTIPESLCIAMFEKLPIRELLRCRLVSKKWSRIASHPQLWRSHALALTESDADALIPPEDEHQWEGIVKNLYLRERNWSHGLAQKIQLCEGHTGFVTSMKLRGKDTLVTGSYDGSIRIWKLSSTEAPTCKREIKAEKIACLDFVLLGRGQGIIAAGLYDVGRTLVFDLRTGELLQTLAGHNKGIRHVAVNQSYVVSTGQDKSICVFDHRTGERIIRFGQQLNVSLGVCLVDSDKLVAVTVDGIIRSFSIRTKKMLGEFDISKLSGARGEHADAMKALTGDGGMLSWFAADGTSLTVASKSLVAHLQWREHVVPVRARKDSTESSYSASPRPGAESKASSSTSLSTVSTPARRNGTSTPARNSGIKGEAPSTTSKPSSRSEVPPLSPGAARSPLSPSTPGRPTSARAAVASPTRVVSMRASQTSGTPSRSGSSPSMLGFGRAESSISLDDGEAATTTRLAPNLTIPPRLTSVLRTPEAAVGVVDPQKRRMVCASRFTSRAGAERRLYTSTYTDTAESGGEATGVQTGGGADRFVPIGGAWEARAAELSTPERNPMAMVLDHESIVVGCSDGLVYRIGFVGDEHSPSSGKAVEITPASEVGDATITDLIQLRGVEGWRDLFLPEGTKDDHSGRVKVDLVKKVGLR